MGTVDRRQGSGRPQSARTDENTDEANQQNDMVMSQEDQPQTHSKVREISRSQAFLSHLLYERICSWSTFWEWDTTKLDF